MHGAVIVELKKKGKNMSRLIDADALLERMRAYANDDWNNSLGGLFTDAVDTCIDFVECAETIEAVEVVHGEVITTTDRFHVMHQKCSVCGEELEWKAYPNFCPNCGCRMDGVK